MSNNNYMDRVPVKISEKFKPPPKLYQLPQVIGNRLQLPDKHYDESPHYDYDFQLERKVLAKIPEWRRMRQQEREARRERKERREQEHLFQIEAKNKQMLGAVSYPSTDDLSSSDSDSGDVDEKAKQQNDVNKTMNTTEGDARLLLSNQINSFHTILKPTIISNSCNEKYQMLDGSVAALTSQQTNSALKHATLAADAVKDANVFNYRDFEEDTSSPFDNIELKTINDLDILAQVLHNTQLPMQMQNEKQIESAVGGADDTNESELTPKDNNTLDKNEEEENEERKHHKNTKTATTTDVDNREILENTKKALQKVEFENLVEEENESIPNSVTVNSIAHTKYLIGTNSNMPASTASHTTFANQQQNMQQCYQMSYNAALTNGIGGEQQQQQQLYANYNVHHTRQGGGGGGTSTLYGNHNYLQQAANYNDNIAAYCSPRHLSYHNATATAMNSAYMCNNANNYVNTTGLSSCSAIPKNLQQQQQSNNSNNTPNDCNDIDPKSKSVPDILRELSAEVRNSEIRRSRYYSFNSEEEKQSAVNHSVDEDVTPKQSPTKVKETMKETNYYAKLPRNAQRLVKNISSMGFPLERVAKISQIFGTDDKKIIEHLIPLSELMDLGFDESKISEALIKFDNNKEKALEYLIS